MSKLSELEKQAEEIQKQIRELKGNKFLEKFLTEIKQPNTYINNEGYWYFDIVVHYDKKNKDIFFEGKQLVCGSDRAYPYVEKWESCGYSIDGLRDDINKGRIKIYHDNPRPIMKVLDERDKYFHRVLVRIRQLSHYPRGEKRKITVPDFKKMKPSEIIKYAIENLDNTCFKRVTDYGNVGTETVIYNFRVADCGDDTHVLKCIRITQRVAGSAANGYIWPSIDEDYIVGVVSCSDYVMMGKSLKKLAKQLCDCMDGFELMTDVRINLTLMNDYYRELADMMTACENLRLANKTKVYDEVQNAIGVKK